MSTRPARSAKKSPAPKPSPPSCEPADEPAGAEEDDPDDKASSIVARILAIIDERLVTVQADKLEFEDLRALAQTARSVSSVRGDRKKTGDTDETYEQLLQRAKKIPGLRESLLRGDDE